MNVLQVEYGKLVKAIRKGLHKAGVNVPAMMVGVEYRSYPHGDSNVVTLAVKCTGYEWTFAETSQTSTGTIVQDLVGKIDEGIRVKSVLLQQSST